MKKLGKWLDENLEGTILMVLLAAFSCVMMLQVIMRYAFGNALSWAEEVVPLLFCIQCIFKCTLYGKERSGNPGGRTVPAFPESTSEAFELFL